MSLDRFIHFKKGKAPTVSALRILFEDYIGEAGCIDITHERCFYVRIKGVDSFPFARIAPDLPNPYKVQLRARYIEVYIGDLPKSLDVITRFSDEFTNTIAAGYVKIVARWWQGKVQV